MFVVVIVVVVVVHVCVTQRTRHNLDELVGARALLDLLHDRLNVAKAVGLGELELALAVDQQAHLHIVVVLDRLALDVLRAQRVTE